ncbi:asparagine synthase (glutamine-hydrolyzing) [Thermococcus sp. GR7]|uniref:asparagine synthase (glutamine-hydrolyzing) n=1 Tax=unclassified Thermococcus TaxID=2627626 RepID=UPI001430C430|nr:MULTISPECIES: asparagine synthase (glutamine-hydrolyzing) [unclassified Thermococcus]NJE47417.1 asparagine synthase (glutamine-hydrolyzing) [Thermococcus sp. GR7]NJE79475.1 asparagine synthase (glutamine-hydrolyzing) [Thermococcus sp. GR4]NJF23467.1 asparagine synthase (glutamine-hydrolyzing) [Thermococcus sp. GR5]
MCLVAGGIGTNLKEHFTMMILAGKHRGEDSFGVWTNEGVLKSEDFSKLDEIPDGRIGLLQCRLAMTGSFGYTQPFYNDLALVHNGEIYNHNHIRNYLKDRGVSFESDVDSEVILRLLEYLLEKGLNVETAVKKAMSMLEGDYAVAFSDGRRIYLFRDPVGVRPLYYSPNGFFASEKKVLWAIGERAIPVQPGELILLSREGVQRRKLFSILELKRMVFSEERAKLSLIRTLTHAVRVRVEKRTGILFSGGLDSSLIALTASRYSDVVLYTAGAEGSQDLEWARKVSEELGLPLREYVFDLDDVKEAVPKVAFAIEESNPMNLAIGIPLYFATKLAREDGCKLLLSGQGADELFGGYAKYLERPELMESDLLEIGEKNLVRDDKIAMLNSVEGRVPFLDLAVISTAFNTPPEAKIRKGIRKAILREVAVELGLPKWIAERDKKAAQYGSGAQKLLKKLAKSEGMTLREYAQRAFNEAFKRG